MPESPDERGSRRGAWIVPFSLEVDSDNRLFRRPIFRHLRERLASDGVSVNTVDLLDPDELDSRDVLIVLNHRIRDPLVRWAVRLTPWMESGIERYTADSFLATFDTTILIQFEPPVVMPRVYEELSRLESIYDRVFVSQERPGHRQFVTPYNPLSPLDSLFGRGDRQLLVMINSDKRPRSRRHELYSERLRALEHFTDRPGFHLYGHGWDRRARSSRSWRQRLEGVYRGTTPDKLDTLSRYRFSLCYENSRFAGYITEKIFDCLVVGTIPVYYGASDIEEYVDPRCFVDLRTFGSYGELETHLRNVGEHEFRERRAAIREYLASEASRAFSKERFANLVANATVA